MKFEINLAPLLERKKANHQNKTIVKSSIKPGDQEKIAKNQEKLLESKDSILEGIFKSNGKKVIKVTSSKVTLEPKPSKAQEKTHESIPITKKASQKTKKIQKEKELPESKIINSTRAGFGESLLAIAKKNNKVVALCADVRNSLKLKSLSEQLADQYVEVGVAEQNMIGLAAGLALRGKIPFACSYAVFNTGRNYEQIRNAVAYSNLNVKIVGSHAGLATGEDGATHQMLEDLALMRILPHMTIVVPADYLEAKKAVKALVKLAGPAYLRLSRPDTEVVSHESTPFEIGQANLIWEGRDITVIACGTMVRIALYTAQKMASAGIGVRVINMHTLKPIDQEAIIDSATKSKAIITLEDHQIIGGLGSAVAEVMTSEFGKSLKKMVPLVRLGVNDQFGQSGNYEELYEKHGLTVDNLTKVIKSLVK